MKSQRGMTLLEIVIAAGIMAVMMMVAWRVIAQIGEANRMTARMANNEREVRMALERVVRDMTVAYLSKNEDENAVERRTFFIAKAGGDVPELAFSSLAHQPLWADANESSQTVISYRAEPDPDPKHAGEINWIRREQRRMGVDSLTPQPFDEDILLRNIARVEFAYWDWKEDKWKDAWNSSSPTGEKSRLPERVRIKVTLKGEQAESSARVYTTQARLLLQEAFSFVPQ